MRSNLRWISVLMAALLALVIAPQALAATPDDYNRNTPQLLLEDHLNAEAAVLMDGTSGRVLFSKNARVRMYPASTTKVMTLLLALESGIALDTPVIIPQQAAQIPSDSTLVPVFPGDQMTFGDLLYGFMLSSGNDGANAVAVLVGGSLDAFVERMNARAAELGCEGTHFANAHGYHADDHYTTAQDLALITQAALNNETFRKIVACQRYTMTIRRNGETITPTRANTNVMINPESGYYYADCIGVKTGTHSRAGNCFVGASERGGVRLVSVVLKCAQANQKWVDTIRLFNYGYTRYTPYSLEQLFAAAGDQIGTVKISNAIESDPDGGGLKLNIAQISNPDYARMVAADDDDAMDEAIADFVSRSTMTITHAMVAPVSEGEIMGQLRYVAQNGEAITALLIAGRDIQAQPPKASLTDFFPFLKKLEEPLVQALIVVVAALIALLILAGMLRRASRQRRRRRIYEARRRERMRDAQARRDREREARRRREAAVRAERREKWERRERRDDDFDDFDDFDDYDEYDDYDE